MYQFVLFDFDGTICDSAEGIVRSVQYALRDQGIEEPLEALYCFCGPLLSDMFQSRYHMTEAQALRAVEKYRERYRVQGLRETRLYPGIPALLRALREEGRRLAVASSKPEQFVTQLLSQFGILDCFEAVVGARLDGSFGRKAEVVQRALTRLGVTEAMRSDAVLVGDRVYDVLGAKEAGIDCIGAGYGYANPGELLEAGARYVAEDVPALSALLLTDGRPYA